MVFDHFEEVTILKGRGGGGEVGESSLEKISRFQNVLRKKVFQLTHRN